MARISGINIPDNKKVEFALRYIYGVGHARSRILLETAKISVDKRAKDLTSEEIGKLQAIIDRGFKVEGDLRREVAENIKRLKEIAAWRGIRHARRLPIHGRSRTNSRTVRGNVRKPMGSGRKPAAQKT